MKTNENGPVAQYINIDSLIVTNATPVQMLKTEKRG